MTELKEIAVQLQILNLSKDKTFYDTHRELALYHIKSLCETEKGGAE